MDCNLGRCGVSRQDRLPQPYIQTHVVPQGGTVQSRWSKDDLQQSSFIKDSRLREGIAYNQERSSPGISVGQAPLRGEHRRLQPGDEDSKKWMMETLERQHASLQSLMVQQHEVLHLLLTEKLNLLFRGTISNRAWDAAGGSGGAGGAGGATGHGLLAQAGWVPMDLPDDPPGSSGALSSNIEDLGLLSALSDTGLPADEAGGVGRAPEPPPTSLPYAACTTGVASPETGGAAMLEELARAHSRRNSDWEDPVATAHLTPTQLRISRLVKSKTFDVVMGLIIIFNMVCMFVQLEWTGYEASLFLDLKTDDGAWMHAEIFFTILEEFFNGVYVVELTLRLYIFGCGYFKEAANVVDFCVVMATSIEAYVLRPAGWDSGIGGLIRVFRVIRVMRVMRFLTQFSELRVLMRAVVESASAFLWSMLLACVVIVAGGIFMAQLSAEFIIDETLEEATRLWLFRYYGSAAKATYTMFEVTFSGAWVSRARPTMEDVNTLFGFFWAGYILLITFAMVRLMAALFLKQTMQVAANDKERMMFEKMKGIAVHLRTFFEEADKSKDGLISEDELGTFLCQPQIHKMLESVDLEVKEIVELFTLLDDGNGSVSFDDFLGGAMRLKGSVRSTDAIAFAHELALVKRDVRQVAAGMEILFCALNHKGKWTFRRGHHKKIVISPEFQSSGGGGVGADVLAAA